MGKGKLTVCERRRLRTLLQETREARVYRRVLSVLEYDRGMSISAVAKSLGVSRQSVHNWIARFRESGEVPLSCAMRLMWEDRRVLARCSTRCCVRC